MLAGTGAAAAALAHPSLPALPLLAATLAGIWRWARRRPGGGPRSSLLLAGQLYTGAATGTLHSSHVCSVRCPTLLCCTPLNYQRVRWGYRIMHQHAVLLQARMLTLFSGFLNGKPRRQWLS